MRSNSAVRVTGVEHSRRFLRELDEAPRENNLQYILKYPCIPFFVTRGCTMQLCWEAMEGAPGSCVRGPLTETFFGAGGDNNNSLTSSGERVDR